MAGYALRFISGKYQGGEFPLRMDREVLIGRSSDLDMVLVEDMVSRKHAVITTQGGQILIQDLGSTNGTFVNGEKIDRTRKTRLNAGDRILIGTSIIKLVSSDGALPSDAEARSQLERSASGRSTVAGKPMSGTIEEIPLPDLLQLLSTSRKSGVLAVRSTHGVGKIYLRQGRIYYGCINDAFDVPPRKAVFRILTWAAGSFELEPPDDRKVLEEIAEPTEALLLEGVRQIDELRNAAVSLPPPDAALSIAVPLRAPLRDLSPEQLDVLQLVLNTGSLQGVMDSSRGSDLETGQAVASLLERGYLVAT
jgi:hypothetical protein